MVSEPQEELRQGKEFAEPFRNGKGGTGEITSRSLAATSSPRKPALDGDQVRNRVDNKVDKVLTARVEYGKRNYY